MGITSARHLDPVRTDAQQQPCADAYCVVGQKPGVQLRCRMAYEFHGVSWTGQLLRFQEES